MSSMIFQYGLLAALAILLLIAAYTDIRSRKIANWLVLAVAAGAPMFWIASGVALWPGVALQIGMTLGTFAVLAGLFALRAMGGGDVKLLSALALWFEPTQFLRLLIIMALLGGLLTIVLGAWHVARRQTHRLAIPYGVAISAAGLWHLGTQFLPSLHQTAGNLG
jgi:prepilin peptidase CpaA